MRCDLRRICEIPLGETFPGNPDRFVTRGEGRESVSVVQAVRLISPAVHVCGSEQRVPCRYLQAPCALALLAREGAKPAFASDGCR